MTKLTKVQKFEMVLEFVQGHPVLEDFIKNEMEMVSRKNARKAETKAPTKTQKENDVIKENLLAILNTEEFKTFAEINQELGTDYTSQKLTSLFKQLNGLVEKGQKDKKVAYKLF